MLLLSKKAIGGIWHGSHMFEILLANTLDANSLKLPKIWSAIYWKFSENKFLVTFFVWQSPNSFFIICDFTPALPINNSLYS
jgi:hypothetical protein